MSPSNSSFERYLAIETAGGANWHPYDNKIAFGYNAPGYYQIYSVPIEKGKALWPTRLTFEKNRCTSPYFLSDGTIIFLKDEGGNENFQIGLIEENFRISYLTTAPKAKHLIDLTTEDAIYYAANTEDKKRFDIYRRFLPLADNDPECLYNPETSLAMTRICSSDGRKLIIRAYHSNNHQELLLIDLESGCATSLTKSISPHRQNRWDAVRWLDEDNLLAITDANHDFFRLGILNLNGDFKTIEEIEKDLRHDLYITPDPCTAWVPETPFTYFANNEEGYCVFYRGIFSTEGVDALEPVRLPLNGAIPYGDSRSFSTTPKLSVDGKFMALTISSANTPTNIWILDLEENHAWKATQVSISGLNPASFIETTLHDFHSFDALRVPYFRYIPAGIKPSNGWPAIFIIHGGPEAQMMPSFSPEIQYFLSVGFAVIAPNIRGSTGYGKTYLDLDNVEKRLDSILDIKQLALHVKQNDPAIDGNNLVIFGGSYGGFAVLSAMTEHPELWKAGIDIVGISNFVTFLQNTAAWRRKLREAEYGSLEHDMEILKRISPIHRVSKIAAPLLIIQGDNDERVPLSESIQIYETLKVKDLPVRLLRFADEGHGLAKLKNRIKAFSEIVLWLKEIL
ncbi:MAG: prolyl oligopeptidase family serine peptidase [Candidatus Hodarchaeota archaeon]